MCAVQCDICDKLQSENDALAFSLYQCGHEDGLAGIGPQKTSHSYMIGHDRGRAVDALSVKMTGRKYRDLPDDGQEQDHVMHEFCASY